MHTSTVTAHLRACSGVEGAREAYTQVLAAAPHVRAMERLGLLLAHQALAAMPTSGHASTVRHLQHPCTMFPTGGFERSAQSQRSGRRLTGVREALQRPFALSSLGVGTPTIHVRCVIVIPPLASPLWPSCE
jgi:hypothetical protein